MLVRVARTAFGSLRVTLLKHSIITSTIVLIVLIVPLSLLTSRPHRASSRNTKQYKGKVRGERESSLVYQQSLGLTFAMCPCVSLFDDYYGPGALFHCHPVDIYKYIIDNKMVMIIILISFIHLLIKRLFANIRLGQEHGGSLDG